MQKKVALRRFGVVAGLTAGLIGIGGVTAGAFAADARGVLPTSSCPPGYTGVVITVSSIDASVCENI